MSRPEPTAGMPETPAEAQVPGALRMRFHVISIFPEFVRSVFDYGVVRRAVEAGILGFSLTDPRDFTEDRHRSTDDMPYGGGPGMVMLAEPLFRAISALRAEHGENTPVIYLSPAGEPLSQALAAELAGEAIRNQVQRPRDACRGAALSAPGPGEEDAPGRPQNAALAGGSECQPASALVPCPSSLVPSSLILICGRYEGVDQRLLDEVGARELSIGDYVLSGGELAAMVLIDAVARLLPGVLGNEESSGVESFSPGPGGRKLLDWPHYTRPEIWRGRRVPEVLLSGNHAKIAGFREDAALLLTFQRRPDLLSPELRKRAEGLLAQEDRTD